MSISTDNAAVNHDIKCFSTEDGNEETYEVDLLIGRESFWNVYLGRKKYAKTSQFVIKVPKCSTAINEGAVRDVVSLYGKRGYRNGHLVKVVAYNLDGVIVMERGLCTLKFFLKHQGRPLNQTQMGDMICDIGKALEVLKDHNYWDFGQDLASSIVLFKKDQYGNMTFKLSNFGLSKIENMDVNSTKGKKLFFTLLADSYHYAATLTIRDPIPLIPSNNKKELEYDIYFTKIFQALLREMVADRNSTESYNRIAQSLTNPNAEANFVIVDQLRITKFVNSSLTEHLTIADVLGMNNCWLIDPQRTVNFEEARIADLRHELVVLERQTRLEDIIFKFRIMNEIVNWTNVNSSTARSTLHELLNRGRTALEEGERIVNVVKKTSELLRRRDFKHDNDDALLLSLQTNRLEIEKTISSYFEIFDEDLAEWENKKFDTEAVKFIVEKCFAWRQRVENEFLFTGSSFDKMLTGLRKVAEEDSSTQGAYTFAQDCLFSKRSIQKLLDLWILNSDPNLEEIVNIGFPEMRINNVNQQFEEILNLCDAKGIGISMTHSLIMAISTVIASNANTSSQPESEVEISALMSLVTFLLNSKKYFIQEALLSSGILLLEALRKATIASKNDNLAGKIMLLQSCLNKNSPTPVEHMDIAFSEDQMLKWTPWDGHQAFLSFDDNSLISQNGKSNIHLVKSLKHKDKLLDGVKFALKLYKDDELWGLSRKRLINEVTILSKCGASRNIVELYGVFEANSGMNGFIMEYCDNGTLYDAIHSNDELKYSDKFSFCLQAATAVAFLQEQNIIHRDIKPSKFTMVGTPGYIAPEISAEKMYFLESDVYSLAVTIWELMVTRRPTPDSKIDLEDYSFVPHWMKDVVKRMAAVNKNERPSMKVVLEIFNRNH